MEKSRLAAGFLKHAGVNAGTHPQSLMSALLAGLAGLMAALLLLLAGFMPTALLLLTWLLAWILVLLALVRFVLARHLLCSPVERHANRQPTPTFPRNLCSD